MEFLNWRYTLYACELHQKYKGPKVTVDKSSPAPGGNRQDTGVLPSVTSVVHCFGQKLQIGDTVTMACKMDEHRLKNGRWCLLRGPEIIDITGRVAALIPYVVSALAKESLGQTWAIG